MLEATTGPLGWLLGLWPFGRHIEPDICEVCRTCHQDLDATAIGAGYGLCGTCWCARQDQIVARREAERRAHAAGHLVVSPAHAKAAWAWLKGYDPYAHQVLVAMMVGALPPAEPGGPARVSNEPDEWELHKHGFIDASQRVVEACKPGSP